MKYHVILLACLFSQAGFAATKSGKVTMKINPSLVQVDLGERDVVIGDRVAVFKKTCSVGGKNPVCTKERVGGGSVSRVLNEVYSEVQLDGGVRAGEGYVVERQ